MPLIEAVGKVLPILLMLSLGALIRRANFLSENSLNELKKLVVNVSLPALLFTAFLNMDFQPKYAWIVLIMFALNFLMLGIGRLLSVFIAAENVYFPLMFTGFEMGMLGFSLFGTVYGMEGLSAIGILDLGQEAYVWFVLTAFLYGLRDKSVHFNEIVKSFATSPVIIAILLGLGLNVTGLAGHMNGGFLFKGVFSTLGMVSQLTIPLILILIGSQLSLRLKELYLPAITQVLRTAVLVAVALLLDSMVFKSLLNTPRLFSAALFTIVILPPPFIVPLFMDNGREKDLAFVSNTLSLGTLTALLGFVLITVIFA
jgi:predicted permease